MTLTIPTKPQRTTVSGVCRVSDTRRGLAPAAPLTTVHNYQPRHASVVMEIVLFFRGNMSSVGPKVIVVQGPFFNARPVVSARVCFRIVANEDRVIRI